MKIRHSGKIVKALAVTVVSFLFTFAVMMVSLLSIIYSQYDEQKYQDLEEKIAQNNLIVQEKIDLNKLPANIEIMMNDDKKLEVKNREQGLLYIIVNPENHQVARNYNSCEDYMSNYYTKVIVYSMVLAVLLSIICLKIWRTADEKNQEKTNGHPSLSTVYMGKLELDDELGDVEDD